MGAEIFIQKEQGKTPQEAFKNAVREAEYNYGHAGYTGTIAEKDSYILIDLPEEMEAQKYAEFLINEDDSRIADKWGPAGCIPLDKNEYLFFGWASS